MVPGTPLVEPWHVIESNSNPPTSTLVLLSTAKIIMHQGKHAPLPSHFVDSHHHFLDTKNNTFQTFLAKCCPDEIYLPSNYESDVTHVLKHNGITLIGTVHVECMPDEGALEVAWVESQQQDTMVRAVVGSCDLASSSVEKSLNELIQASPRVKGVRWILDCGGDGTSAFEPNTATHVATTRHGGIDYLRGGGGGSCNNNNTDIAVLDFERGYALLEKFQLSFDLQCAPIQLQAAAKLCAKYPNIPVCINHLGKPRQLLRPDVVPMITSNNKTTITMNQNELRTWRDGMTALAALPHVYVKISMIGYAIPGWIRTPERTKVAKDLCREVVELFGPQRCMVGLNWWKDSACSDSDGASNVGPDPVELLQCISDWFSDYSQEDRDSLFYKTASKFYRF